MSEGWEPTEWQHSVEAHQKMFGDGPDVIVAIQRIGKEFNVMSSAESRTSGPNETIHGTVATLAEARELAGKERKHWDELLHDADTA